MKIYDSRLNFHYIGSLGFSWKWTNIGSDNDLVPKNCQATIKDQMKTQPTDAYMLHTASIGFHQNIHLVYYSYTRIYVQPSNIIYMIFVYTRQTFHMYAVVADVTGQIIWMHENTV